MAIKIDNIYYTDPFLNHIWERSFQSTITKDTRYDAKIDNTYYFLTTLGETTITRYEQYLLHGFIFKLHWERSFQTTIIM